MFDLKIFSDQHRLTYFTPRHSSICLDLADQAISNLHPTEKQLLITLIEEGIRVRLIRDDVSFQGAWLELSKTIELTVSAKGNIPLGTITHEFKHYRQWAEGRLSILKGKLKWEGEIWALKESGLGYFEQPWEQEAFKAECEFLSAQGLRLPSTVHLFLKRFSIAHMEGLAGILHRTHGQWWRCSVGMGISIGLGLSIASLVGSWGFLLTSPLLAMSTMGLLKDIGKHLNLPLSTDGQ